MPQGSEAETVLIVDDEEPVRRTFREWLEGANLGCDVLTAADAEAALLQANRHPIDLAILDWNLGAGNDGLHLLEDLYLFNPDVAAIMITGFAHQATPLDAMRMGVRAGGRRRGAQQLRAGRMTAARRSVGAPLDRRSRTLLSRPLNDDLYHPLDRTVRNPG